MGERNTHMNVIILEPTSRAINPYGNTDKTDYFCRKDNKKH